MIVVKIFCSIILLCSEVIAQCDDDENLGFRYDYKYMNSAPGFFKMHLAPTTWDNAREICRLEGAELAAPENRSITGAMYRLAHFNKAKIIHTGYNTRYLPGAFVSTQGCPLVFNHHTWQYGEPKLNGKLVSSISMNDKGHLAIDDLDSKYSFICYKGQTPVVDRNKCGIHDHDYSHIREVYCYKIHQVPQTWELAVATCYGQGAHLVVINSDEEMDFLTTNIFNKQIGVDDYWVGFRESNETGEWLTIFDEYIENSGYMKWAPDAPYGKHDSNCGIVKGKIKKLADEDCKKRLRYVCEMIPHN